MNLRQKDNNLEAKQTGISLQLKTAGIWLLMFLCAFIPFRSPLSGLTTSAIKAIPDILILGLFCWYSVEIRFRYKFRPCDIFFMAFIFIGFVSTVVINQNGILLFIFQVRSIGVYYLMFFVLRNFGYGKNEFCRVVQVLHIVVYVLFVLAIIEKVFSKDVLFPQERASTIIYADNFARTYSMFYNPNTYGAFLSLTCVLTLYKRLVYCEKSHLVIYVSIVTSLLLSMSRSSIILLAMGLIGLAGITLFKYCQKIDWKRFTCAFFVIMICGVVLSEGAHWANVFYVQAKSNSLRSEGGSDNFDDSDDQIALDDRDTTIKQNASSIKGLDRFEELGEESILERSAENGRIYSVRKGLEILADYPALGTGFGSFGSSASLQTEPKIYEKYGIPDRFYADNEYIKVLVETGIVGTLVFVAFLASVLWLCRKNWYKIIFCIMVGGIGLFYNVFEIQIVAMMLWMFLSFSDPDKLTTTIGSGDGELSNATLKD